MKLLIRLLLVTITGLLFTATLIDCGGSSDDNGGHRSTNENNNQVINNVDINWGPILDNLGHYCALYKDYQNGGNGGGSDGGGSDGGGSDGGGSDGGGNNGGGKGGGGKGGGGLLPDLSKFLSGTNGPLLAGLSDAV